MLGIERFVTVAYVLTVIVGGYLAVSSLKNLWSEAERFEQIITVSASGAVDPHTFLVFDSVQPAAGQ
jgi:hypothetical protein